MKKIIALLILSVFAVSVFSQEVEETEDSAVESEENDSYTNAYNLISDGLEGLFGNQEKIQKEAVNISMEDKLSLYNNFKNKPLLPFVLNLFLGSGIGSFVQRDFNNGIIVLGGTIVSFSLVALGFEYLYLGKEIHSDYSSDIDFNNSSDSMAVILTLSGSILIYALRIYSCICPFIYSSKFNRTLRNCLGITENQKIALAPVVNISDKEIGFVAKIAL